MPGSNREIVAGSHDGFNSVRAAARPTSLQKIEFDVTTAEGPSRVKSYLAYYLCPGAGHFQAA